MLLWPFTKTCKSSPDAEFPFASTELLCTAPWPHHKPCQYEHLMEVLLART